MTRWSFSTAVIEAPTAVSLFMIVHLCPKVRGERQPCCDSEPGGVCAISRCFNRDGERTTENGRRRTENGQRTTDNGERPTENGQRGTEEGERTTDHGERPTQTGERRAGDAPLSGPSR